MSALSLCMTSWVIYLIAITKPFHRVEAFAEETMLEVAPYMILELRTGCHKCKWCQAQRAVLPYSMMLQMRKG